MNPDERTKLYKQALLLEYFTIGYNFLEAACALLFGKIANSIALIGFGLDSIIESLSGFVLVWRLRKFGRISKEEEMRIETRAMRFVAVTFFLLGLYVCIESLRKLVLAERPESSLPGIILAALSLAVMPILARRKRSLGISIQSPSLIADSQETLACSFLSLALLLGLGLNFLFRMWYADAVAGLVIVFFLFREGKEVWEEART